jgi:hypothetical protein
MHVDRKLALRLALIAALPEPILLERLRRLSKAELTVFRKRYGIRECCRKGACAIRQYSLWATKRQVIAEMSASRRSARQRLRELRSLPSSMHQSRCQCAASRQTVPPIPFSVHQLLAALLVPEGETAPHRPRTRPNRERTPLRKAA